MFWRSDLLETKEAHRHQEDDFGHVKAPAQSVNVSRSIVDRMKGNVSRATSNVESEIPQ